MQSDPEKLLKRHEKLIHSDMLTVVSHIQREEVDWLVNTLMIRGYDVPFCYKRKDKYKNLTGQRVNLTYYPDVRMVAGIEFEMMKVVRIRVA